MALGGSRGVYLLEIMDIGWRYKVAFASFIRCVYHLQAKGEKFAQLNTKILFDKLVMTLATLEVSMPVHWNTITRNLLLLQPKWLEKFGAIWATGMLDVESLHVLLKSLCRNRNHMMVSFMEHYKIFSTNQLSWRFCTEYANDPRPSSLAWKQPEEDKDTGIEVLGDHLFYFLSIVF
jgi:hypothetical protein